MNDIIRSIEQEQLRSDIPDFRPGDTVRVDVKVVEGNKERIQAFEGVVIKRPGTGLSETFTVRRSSRKMFPNPFPTCGQNCSGTSR